MILLYVLIVVFIIVIAIILIYYSWSRDLLFWPSCDEIWKPDEEYKDKYLKKTRCNMWYFERDKSYPVILYLHGNAANITYRKYVVDLSKKVKCNMLLLDYRGYGRSRPDFKPTIKSIMEDAEEAYEWLQKRYADSRIIVWGESLGGAVAVHVGAKYRCRSLILFSTFSSIGDLTKFYIGGAWGTVASVFVKCTNNILVSKEKIKRVRCPVLIVHSIEDTFVKHENAQILYDNILHKNKILLTIRGNHTDPILDKTSVRVIHNFCKDVDADYLTDVDIQKLIESLEKDCAVMRRAWKESEE